MEDCGILHSLEIDSIFKTVLGKYSEFILEDKIIRKGTIVNFYIKDSLLIFKFKDGIKNKCELFYPFDIEPHLENNEIHLKYTIKTICSNNNYLENLMKSFKLFDNSGNYVDKSKFFNKVLILKFQ